MLTGQFALTTAAIFTGAAIYVSLCEQPARLQLDDRALLIEWKPSYKHGFAMQAPLALIGAAWLRGLVAGGRLALARRRHRHPLGLALYAAGHQTDQRRLLAIDPVDAGRRCGH